MYCCADKLDDLLRSVLEKLLEPGQASVASTRARGSYFEVIGAVLELTNPLARLSRTESKGTVYSGLGELIWYLAKSNALDFISYYIHRYTEESDDDETIYGAYGPRLFNKNGIDQVNNVIRLLSTRETSRQAVIQIFAAEDLVEAHKEIPCTCTLQFLLREKKLHMFTSMRSNDAFYGLPHDVFSFTMLQEIIARALGVEVGTYKHAVGSLHLYEKHIESAKDFLAEGWQSSIAMPSMPIGDPRPVIDVLVRSERAIRLNEPLDINGLGIDPYWADLLRLLKVFRHQKDRNVEEIIKLKTTMQSSVYKPYIEKMQDRL